MIFICKQLKRPVAFSAVQWHDQLEIQISKITLISCQLRNLIQWTNYRVAMLSNSKEKCLMINLSMASIWQQMLVFGRMTHLVRTRSNHNAPASDTKERIKAPEQHPHQSMWQSHSIRNLQELFRLTTAAKTNKDQHLDKTHLHNFRAPKHIHQMTKKTRYLLNNQNWIRKPWS